MSINRFSKVFVPSEYIAPFDLNSYAALGMQKEQEFDRNYQLLQSGLQKLVQDTDIYRPQDQQEFNKRVLSVVNEINTHGNEDLGDPSVLANMQNSSTRVYDADMISAMGATKLYRADQKRMADDQKKGNLAPQNVHAFQKTVQPWLDPNNKEVGMAYTGSYEQYYDGNKKVFDALKLKKDSGTLSSTAVPGARLADGSTTPSVQTDVITTKGVTEEDVKSAVSEVLATDPRVMRQHQIDMEYVADGMSEESIRDQYQTFSEQQGIKIGNEIAQLTTQKQQALASEPTEQGKKRLTAYFDGEIQKAYEDQSKFVGYSDDLNRDKLLGEVKKDKYKFYNEIFTNNYLNGFANIFSHKTQSVNRLTDAAVLDQLQFEHAHALLVARGKIKPGPAEGYIFVDKAQEGEGSQMRGKLLLQQQQNEQREIELNDNFRDNIIHTPETGKHYERNAAGDKNFKEQVAKWLELYKVNVNDDNIPQAAKDYFAETDKLRESKLAVNSMINAAEAKRLQDPRYQQAAAAYEEGVKNAPKELMIEAGDGHKEKWTQEEWLDVDHAKQSGNFDEQEVTLLDKNSDVFGDKHTIAGLETPPIKVRFLKGNGPGVRRYNDQLNRNLKKAIDDAKNYNLSGIDAAPLAGQKFVYEYLAEKGVDVTPPESWPSWAAGKISAVVNPLLKLVFMTPIGAGLVSHYLEKPDRLGTGFDLLYRNTRGTNHSNVDGLLDSTHFYEMSDKLGTELENAADRAYASLDEVHMSGIQPINSDEKTQSQFINLVRRLNLTYSTEKPVESVESIERNHATGGLVFTFVTDKKTGKSAQVELPADKEGTVGNLVTINPMQDVEKYLRAQSILNKGEVNRTGVATTPLNYEEALVVPGTNLKVYYKYNPVTLKYSFAFWEKYNWGTEFHVDTLSQVQEVAAKVMKSEQAASSSK
jgi:hypothetical protein